MGFIFDNIGYTGLLENTVQNGLGKAPCKDTVERGGGYGGIVGLLVYL
jgi:hypothetical protein